MSPRASLRVPLLALLLVGATTTELPPIVQAAKDRDGELLRGLLRDGADATAAAPDGSTALHWASYWDDIDGAELLLRAGADASAANDLGATPLWNASLNGSGELVRLLLARGADPNAALLSGETAVMTAARTGSAEVLELLLDAGGDPNVPGTRDQTALMWAAAQGHAGAVRVLLERGADVHARSETRNQLMAVPPHSDPANQQMVPHGGYTALLFAGRIGDVESAKLLLAAGADVDAADSWGVTPLVLAAHSGFLELVTVLLGEGADANAAGAGFSALHLAVMRRDEAMARVLLEHGADANARLQNWTPTRRSSDDWHIHPSLVGATPFWMAARLGQPGTMRLLVEHGADPLFVHEVRYVAQTGAFGFGAEAREERTTALMAAVGMGGPRRLSGYLLPDPADAPALRAEAAQLVLELGVDPGARDMEGRTALEGATDAALRELLRGARETSGSR